ncbi:MAG: hemerythrin domain-containing protein [Desulfotomaculaceae bacterium]|nr:hemerythrin domain-containing protein [Desulfotomaculaceae bacterium]
MGKATQDLRKEHEAILHVLKILDQMFTSTLDATKKLQYYSEVVNFFRIFADKCHHGKEEVYLFEELIKKGFHKESGPVGVMLHEHKLGREYISMMNKSLEAKDLAGFDTAAAKYSALLRQHINKENNVLFIMADEVLDETKQDELFREFEQHEENVIGHGVHEKLHAMIHAWAAEFNVS